MLVNVQKSPTIFVVPSSTHLFLGQATPSNLRRNLCILKKCLAKWMISRKNYCDNWKKKIRTRKP
ncbi:hypothetical protein BC938DRAFT_481303 [Jimgerdemannia flammicorona]|uniref:Uncharacterized protein n=1 Tax=Jimgerdemannia flammicorona TaxID=994334 RepID=A0A433QGG7_9FUNG|nr:hypothetical protein BC938DRAFT_481303 [Jimgerdemannia flammicorona]